MLSTSVASVSVYDSPEEHCWQRLCLAPVYSLLTLDSSE